MRRIGWFLAERGATNLISMAVGSWWPHRTAVSFPLTSLGSVRHTKSSCSERDRQNLQPWDWAIHWKLQHHQHSYPSGQDYAIGMFRALLFDWMSMSLGMANVSLGENLGYAAWPSYGKRWRRRSCILANRLPRSANQIEIMAVDRVWRHIESTSTQSMTEKVHNMTKMVTQGPGSQQLETKKKKKEVASLMWQGITST